MKNLLRKIQGLPEKKRKIIFWVLIILIAAVLIFFDIKSAQKRFKNFRLEKFKEELPSPKIEIPKMPEEIFKIPK
jgi:hypothetical protein